MRRRVLERMLSADSRRLLSGNILRDGRTQCERQQKRGFGRIAVVIWAHACGNEAVRLIEALCGEIRRANLEKHFRGAVFRRMRERMSQKRACNALAAGCWING